MIRILQLTDTHLLDDPGGRVRGFDTDLGLRRCLEHGLRVFGPDLLLLTGDLVHDAAAPAYERLRGHVARSGLPAYALPGNHDDPALLSRLLAAPPLTSPGRVDLGAWQILLADSVVPGEVGGHLAEDELARLDAELTAHPRQHTLLCLHHQPVPTPDPAYALLHLDNHAELGALLARHPGRVRALLWGHIHTAYDRRRDGLRLLGTPSTCFQFRHGPQGLEVDAELPGWRWLELHEDGGLATGLRRCHPRLDRIVSGGQTGVDRAALDVAAALGMERGGWCPRGRRAEDGPLAPEYPLRETPQAGYAQRTEWNVRDSDATLLLSDRPLRGGTALTAELAGRLERPLLVLDPDAVPDAAAFDAWLAGHGIRRLNVAGPRESGRPGIGARAAALLRTLLTGAG